MNTFAQPPSGPASAKREGTTADTIARMQRGILRLALVYHGQNPQLDRKLKEFGALIRNGRGQAAERQRLIDEIVETIVTLDLKQEAKQPPPTGSSSSALGAFLERLSLPETLRPEIENSQRRLAQAGDHAQALKVIQQTANALSEHIMQSPDSCKDAVAIRMLLLELVERLPISAKLVERVSPIRKTIEKADQVEVFIQCIDSVAELVQAMRAELQLEIDQLADYLRVTAERLYDFDKFVHHSNELHSGASFDTIKLNDTISFEIHTLRDDVVATDDILELRKAIDKRLENIDDGLNSFVAAQTKRTAESSKAVQSMAQKLEDLEQQTMSLRHDLRQQQDRIQLDPLTGVLNRTGYNETANKHFARWKRYGGALSLAVIDLDWFKRINDEYGHAAGDRVLATVAAKLQEQIREADVLCRFGGEEFVLILPETELDDAAALLDKLRVHIADCPFRYKDTPVGVTLSCGVAQFHGNDTLDQVFERADKAMYQAKANGRNTVHTDTERGNRANVALVQKTA